MNHHPARLITSSSDDALFVLRRCTRPLPISRLLEADHSSILVPLWLGAGRPRDARRRSAAGPGPKPATDVAKLSASNDRRYAASFQRHVAYIKILEAFVREWAASGAGTATARQRPSPPAVLHAQLCLVYDGDSGQFRCLPGFAKQTESVI